MMKGRLLVKASCLYILGLFIASFFHFTPFIFLFIALIALFIGLFYYNKQKVINLYLIIIFLSVGAFRMATVIVDPGGLSPFADGQEEIKILGTVLTEPKDSGNSISFYFSTHSIYTGSCVIKVREKTVVFFNRKQFTQLIPGQRITVTGIIKKPGERDNFGGFSYQNYLQTKGIHTVIYAQMEPTIEYLPPKRGVQIVSYLIKSKIRDVIFSALPNEDGGLLNCLLLGDKISLNKETIEVFSRSGLSHVLAISGLHIGILAGFLYKIKGKLKINSLIGSIFVVFIILCYCLLVNTVSAYRAGIMFSLFVLAKLSHRAYDLLTGLFAAALFLLLIWPGAIFELGFQLSFGATLGLAVVYSWLVKKINVGGKLFQESLAATIAAIVGTLPVLSYNFNQIHLISLLANLIAVPLTGITIILGWLTVLVGLIFPFLVGHLFLPVTFFLAALRLIADSFGSCPLILHLPRLPLSLVFIYYLLLINTDWLVFCFAIIKKKGKSFIIGFMIILLAAGCLVFKHKKTMLTATVLSVGNADCCFINLPGGKNMLVDAGCEAIFVDGQMKQNSTILLSFLKQRGIRRIDYLVLSHPHFDHYGSLPDLLSDFEVGKIFISSDQDWDRILDFSMKSKICILKKGNVLNFNSGLRAHILHPPAELLLNTGSDPNNNSLVFRLIYKEFSFLFTGDLEYVAEQELIGEDLRSTVLKVPHHGSSTSTSADFLQKVEPSYAIISANNRNSSSEVEERLAAVDAVVFSTYRNGAVRITTNGKKVKITTVR